MFGDVKTHIGHVKAPGCGNRGVGGEVLRCSELKCTGRSCSPGCVHTQTAVCRCIGWCLQVEEVAIKKHGSLEALEEEKQRRMQGKLEQRIQKRQAAEQEEERQRRHEEQLQAMIEKYTKPDGSPPEAGNESDGAGDKPGGLSAVLQAAEHFARPVVLRHCRRVGEPW